MDKEFEEFMQQFMCPDMNTGWNREDVEAAYNFAKQYWLDKAVEVVEGKKEVQPFGESEEVHNNTCFDIAEAIKELKK